MWINSMWMKKIILKKNIQKNILLGNYGLFYLYSTCCVILGIAIYFVMPETTGLSLEEIEEIYRSKAKAKKPRQLTL